MQVRAEAWEGGPGRRLLLMVGDGDRATAFLLAHDPATRLWSRGVGRFDAGAMGSDREGFEPILPMEEAHGGQLWAMGLLKRHPCRVLAGFVKPWLLQEGGRPAEDSEPETLASLAPLGFRPFRHHRNDCLWSGATTLSPPAGKPDPRASASLDWDWKDRLATHLPWLRQTNPAAMALLEPWTATRWLVPTEADFLVDHPWYPDLVAHYTDTGPEGTYRRQAASLYPLLAPAFARHGELRRLVDAGKPFEQAAVDALNRSGLLAQALTRAQLRRLRGVTGSHGSASLLSVIGFATRLAPERLDRMREGGARHFSSEAITFLEKWQTTLDLDLPTLTRRMPERGHPLGATLSRSFDLVRRFGETMVVPLLGQRAYTGQNTLAGQALFAGLSLRAVEAASTRWHARLGAFEAAMPVGNDLATWPALFEPFVLEGIRISCLTTASELREEGSAGPDRDGADGLDHCVGGYARRCWDGSAHILSVRALDGGRWIRLSTVEVAVRNGVPELRQHHGLRNGRPPPEAARALDVLMTALREGSHPMLPEALAPRETGGYSDGIAWEDCETQERTWAAWAPYLPRARSAMELDGFGAWLEAEFMARFQATAA